ncbi:LacI family DNA-binding transcriptional regulator [Paradesertivirga mongoliensis]|uniref:LacI family DNA-binding transcriptional regulator n=1 Tax=Paradesertivirga mongoliensis TaxID=2100740 RepID=A0ABW4ZK97_9SPHI
MDIGKAMGISATTVSRALHDHPDISLSTKISVKEMAIAMDYHPNLLARSFANSQSQTVGVIIPNLEATFFSSMLGGVQKVASQNGYKVLMCQSNEEYLNEVENVHLLMDSRVDGLLICHSIETTNFDHVNIYRKRGIPIINFYRVNKDSETISVVAKNTEGAELVIEHLLNQGCKKIGIILGPRSLLITEERLKGYLNIHKKHLIEIEQSMIAYTDYTYNSIIEIVDRWLDMKERPDAIFCISDRTAIYVIRHLRKKNIQIPAEIAVAGFGNDLMGELIEPGLTTYDVQTSKIGETSMQMFLDQVKNEFGQITKVHTIEGHLVVRESSLKQK